MSAGAEQAVNGQAPSGKRFTTGEYTDLEDISDPHTTRDETRDPIRKKIRRNWWMLFLGIPLAIISFAIVFTYSRHLYPELVGNRYVQVGVVGITWTAIVAVMADRRRQALFLDYDWLVLYTPTGPVRFLGYLRDGEGDASVFEPVKGFSFFGERGEYYHADEVSTELVETYSKVEFDEDDSARIRLHPEFVQIAHTDLGTLVTQVTAGLEVDQEAKTVTHVATEPNLVEQDVAENLKQMIVEERQERQEMYDQLQKMKRRLEHAKEIGAKAPEEYMQEFLQHYQLIEMSRRNPHRAREELQNDDDGRVGETSFSQNGFGQIEQELRPDDE